MTFRARIDKLEARMGAISAGELLAALDEFERTGQLPTHANLAQEVQEHVELLQQMDQSMGTDPSDIGCPLLMQDVLPRRGPGCYGTEPRRLDDESDQA